MIQVDQVVSDRGRGDCRRATVASILELEMEQVPHFRLFSSSQENEVFIAFFWALGWDVDGYTPFSPYREKQNISIEESINGYFLAVVPSRNFEKCLHSVIIDVNGVVVHDPSPKKNYQNENVFETKSINYWYRFSKRK